MTGYGARSSAKTGEEWGTSRLWWWQTLQLAAFFKGWGLRQVSGEGSQLKSKAPLLTQKTREKWGTRHPAFCALQDDRIRCTIVNYSPRPARKSF